MGVASKVGPTELPQTVAAFHSLVGVAAAATSLGEFMGGPEKFYLPFCSCFSLLNNFPSSFSIHRCRSFPLFPLLLNDSFLLCILSRCCISILLSFLPTTLPSILHLLFSPNILSFLSDDDN